MSDQTAEQFYGPAYFRAKKPEKLDAAFRQMNMALKAQSPGIEERALTLAAKNEIEAFA